MTNSGPTSKRDRRAERLKAALRENLRRRKAQERGRAAEAAVDGSDSAGARKGPDKPR